MATLVAAGGQGERIGVSATRDGDDMVAIEFDRPRALACAMPTRRCSRSTPRARPSARARRCSAPASRCGWRAISRVELGGSADDRRRALDFAAARRRYSAGGAGLFQLTWPGDHRPQRGLSRRRRRGRRSLIVWPDEFRHALHRLRRYRGGVRLARAARAATAHGTTRDRGACPRRIAASPIAACRSTYMVDYPIATDPRAVDDPARRDRATGGRRSARSSIPGSIRRSTKQLTPANSFAGNLPAALEAAKLDALTERDHRGVRHARRAPIAPGATASARRRFALLAARGYRLDSSMRARYDYAAEGGPDFSRDRQPRLSRRAGRRDRRTAADDGVHRRARGAAASGFTARWARCRKGSGLFARAGLLSRVALTPEDMPLADALEAVRIAVGEGRAAAQLLLPLALARARAIRPMSAMPPISRRFIAGGTACSTLLERLRRRAGVA